jgi:hypothetical protein
MFYMKHEGMPVYIEPDNAHCLCPVCGDEHRVDLYEIFGDRPIDFYDIEVLCETCSEKRRKERYN